MFAILKHFWQWLRFWLLWIVSCVLNYRILAAVRQFYYTDNVDSDFFKQVSGRIDNWVAIVGGFAFLLMIYLLNAFYKDKGLIVTRFSLVTAMQFLLLGILRLASAPFALKYNSTFQLTPEYIGLSLGLILVSFGLFSIAARMSGEPLKIMVKRLLRLRREDRYW